MKVPLRAGRGDAGEFGASVHSASQSQRKASGGECPSAQLQGRTRAMIYCAQPNQRLKLAAPVPNEFGERFTCGVVEFPLCFQSLIQ